MDENKERWPGGVIRSVGDYREYNRDLGGIHPAVEVL